MVDNQHKKISGYRDLCEEEITAMNNVKELGAIIGNMVETMEKSTTLDQRWVAIGKTEIQKGFMSLVRSIAQPTTF